MMKNNSMHTTSNKSHFDSKQINNQIHEAQLKASQWCMNDNEKKSFTYYPLIEHITHIIMRK